LSQNTWALKNFSELFRLQCASNVAVAKELETDMKKKALAIGGLAVTAALVGGWALAQTVGTDLGGFGPSFMYGQGAGGMGPGMMQHMGMGMGGMGMGHGMMNGNGMMKGMGPGMMHKPRGAGGLALLKQSSTNWKYASR
jgi:hypothetical protein